MSMSSGTAPAAMSAQFDTGAKKMCAPAFSAPNNFWVIPPMGPISPVGVMVPVPATCMPFVSDPGVSLSMMPSANI